MLDEINSKINFFIQDNLLYILLSDTYASSNDTLYEYLLNLCLSSFAREELVFFTENDNKEQFTFTLKDNTFETDLKTISSHKDFFKLLNSLNFSQEILNIKKDYQLN